VNSSIRMNSGTKYLVTLLALVASAASVAGSFDDVLRERILANGHMDLSHLNPAVDLELANAGERLFQSTATSLTSDISCQTCHLENFGSGDGLPVSAAIGGTGESVERFASGAKLLGRNSLALWGRGTKTFKAFFWDGKVTHSIGKIVSQFGSRVPSEDPFVVAIHLPVVEIREMVDETDFIRERKKENVDSAYEVYEKIAENLTEHESDAASVIAEKYNVKKESLEYWHFATAIAEFIRRKFPVKPSKLSGFVNGTYEFTEAETKGGLVFYGKGGCVNCHSGPHFSDFYFHVVAIPQLGFGKNGFGVDYGRYNATFDPVDLYRFRTAPLWNVANTAPFGHSGSLAKLDEAVVAHFDPLRLIDVVNKTSFSRHELYKRLALSSRTAQNAGYLSDEEVAAVVAFLKTLSFK
jgi:cytochrome c peroxidase